MPGRGSPSGCERNIIWKKGNSVRDLFVADVYRALNWDMGQKDSTMRRSRSTKKAASFDGNPPPMQFGQN
jgi:hypothetical protein